MPISFADIGSTYLIKEVTGKRENKAAPGESGLCCG